MDRGFRGGGTSHKRPVQVRLWGGISDASNKAFFDKIVRGSKTVESEADAVRFLSGAVQGDEMSLVVDLTDKSKQGATSLRRALSLACTPSSMDQVVKFLAFLGADVLNKGAAKTCTTQCFMTAFETPGFLNQSDQSGWHSRYQGSDVVSHERVLDKRQRPRECASAINREPAVDQILPLDGAAGDPVNSGEDSRRHGAEQQGRRA